MGKIYTCILFHSILLLLITACSTRPLTVRQQKKIYDKVIVVTGATSGLGRGIALQASAYHAKVVIVARSQEACDKVALEITTKGGIALPVAADVSNKTDMEQLMKEVLREYGHIDVWINNAGVASIGAFWETPLEDHMRVLDVNLKGLLHGSYLAISQFRKQGYGTLINIGSVESEIPTAYQVSYSASKAGVRAIGLTLRQELRLAGLKNIHVITISPWALDTPLWGHVATYTGHQPRMIMMDPPAKAVNAVMHAAIGKKREMPVGLKAHLSYGAHRIFPAFTEKIGSNIAHKYQAEITPAAPDSTGNLYHEDFPAPVEGGYREKMKEEKKPGRRFPIIDEGTGTFIRQFRIILSGAISLHSSSNFFPGFIRSLNSFRYKSMPAVFGIFIDLLIMNNE